MVGFAFLGVWLMVLPGALPAHLGLLLFAAGLLAHLVLFGAFGLFAGCIVKAMALAALLDALCAGASYDRGKGRRRGRDRG